MRRITSRQNALVAEFRAVAGGERDDLLLLDGPHLVAAALDAGLPIRRVLVADNVADGREIASLTARAGAAGAELNEGSASVMDAVSPVRSPSRIVALADRPRRVEQLFVPTPALVVVAADVQDPGNLGAMVRAAEAAGATGVMVAGRSADPFGWKALRGSMGSILRLPVSIVADARAAAAEVRRHGCRLIAAVPRGGRSPYDLDLRQPTAVLIGGEGGGLPDAVVAAADERLTIPMQAPVESLNAAVTAALILYEAHRQRR